MWCKATNAVFIALEENPQKKRLIEVNVKYTKNEMFSEKCTFFISNINLLEKHVPYWAFLQKCHEVSM